MIRLLLLLAALAAATPARARTLDVVASFTVLADMVREVGGEHVRVTSLVGPNGDPHAFEPSPDDARRLKAADLVVVNGLGLEGWMDRLIRASGYAGAPVVASTGIPVRRMEEDGREVTDPHAWNSAANGAAYARTIARALTAADPEDAAAFEANGARYVAELDVLDRDARARFGAIPPPARKVLTSHDAFGYFGAAYGVRFLAPAGLSTETEASARAIARLIGQIKAERLGTYFIENSNDPRLIEQVGRATGARPGGVLYVEALSAPDGPAPTYVAMFKRNVDLIARSMTR